MSKKLKVGIIGLGSMGSTHLDIYSKIKDVEVVAVADSIQSRLMALVKLKVILVVKRKAESLALVLKNILMEWILLIIQILI